MMLASTGRNGLAQKRFRMTMQHKSYLKPGFRSASTIRNRSNLPRLPIPELRDTMERYLMSLEPFYQIVSQESGVSVESLKTQQRGIAESFMRPGGLGQKLQQRLRDLERTSPNNWLDDTIWTRVAYLEQRDSLLVNSNWWLLLQDDSVVPDEVLNFKQGSENEINTTAWQVKRAAWIVKRFLDYRDKVLSGELHPDSSRTGKWLRLPTLRLFGTTRVARLHCDALTIPNNIKFPQSVHILFREWSYEIKVYDDVGNRVPAWKIEAHMNMIVKDVLSREKSGEHVVPVGRLTADDRDRWAFNREHLLSLHSVNASSLLRIEKALFTVSLDDYTYEATNANDSCGGVPYKGHIANVATGVNGTNRWFDKSMNLIFESNTRFGINGEHTPVDALVPSIIADWAISEPIDEKEFTRKECDATATLDDIYSGRLDWEADNRILEECREAIPRALRIINDSDADVLHFNDYGVRWIKEIAMLSPDAYIQMALQLAWFKSRGGFTATYETASTRLFLHGRTETIRSLSRSSIAFVEAMVDRHTTSQIRHSRLKAACAYHNILTRDAALGRGIDRHLLGLRLQLHPTESPSFFQQHLFRQSQDWMLSTSGLSAGDRFMATGFGATHPDGYGINYLSGQHCLKFGVESKVSSKMTSTQSFMLLIRESLSDMFNACNVTLATKVKL